MALVTVAESGVFQRKAASLFTVTEREALIDFLAANPFAGDEVKGTGGVRKVRFAIGGRGKSAGARVIYFIYDLNHPLRLLTCYGKNEKANISDAEMNELAKISAAIKSEYRRQSR